MKDMTGNEVALIIKGLNLLRISSRKRLRAATTCVGREKNEVLLREIERMMKKLTNKYRD